MTALEPTDIALVPLLATPMVTTTLTQGSRQIPATITKQHRRTAYPDMTFGTIKHGEVGRSETICQKESLWKITSMLNLFWKLASRFA
jgi:hypothetical protein